MIRLRPSHLARLGACLLSLWLAPAAARAARVQGRVLERGSINPIPGVRVTSSRGGEATSDAQGRFELLLPDGPVDLRFSAPRHLPLRITEKPQPGQTLRVEYRLLPRAQSPFSALVRGDSLREARFELRGEELRTLPGTLGDPFRAVALLPGVSTPLPLLPLFVIRGASPGMNGFFLNGMRVPQLFHLVVGGGVVHGRLVDRMDFLPSGYGVSRGRFAGGIIDADTRAARGDGYHGEAELRIYDVSGLAELKLPKDLRITASGHFGYPGLLIKLFAPSFGLQYWDYQLRADWRGLTLQALGSFDSLTQDRQRTLRPSGERVEFTDETRVAFHRLQLRYQGRRGPAEYETALWGGVDEMLIFGGSGVRKLALGLRASSTVRLRRLQLAVGADAEISTFNNNFATPSASRQPDLLGDLGDSRNGAVASLYAEATWEILPRELSLIAGARGDLYHSLGITVLAVDPRLQLRYHPTPWLTLHAAGGLYQQPPSFPVALPGLDTFALHLGLQTAVHGMTAIEAALPLGLALKLSGYYQRYYNSTDFNLNDFSIVDLTEGISAAANSRAAITPALLPCGAGPPEELTGLAAQIIRKTEGPSYGGEFMIRRSGGRVSGWIAYTLGRAERRFSCGLRPADYDQPHVLNVVVQARLPWNLMAGARLLVQSGRPATQLQLPDVRTTLRNNARLPTYVQLDLRVDREWLLRTFAIDLFVEVVNSTFSPMTLGLVYKQDAAGNYTGEQVVNSLSFILPTVGLRGRF